jgi:hypothetical protein
VISEASKVDPCVSCVGRHIERIEREVIIGRRSNGDREMTDISNVRHPNKSTGAIS